MRLYLIRHAHAGQRTPDPRDIYRPLSTKGHDRAHQIAGLLGSVGVGSILSSPATRCVQTVEPLAAQLDLEVEEHPDLWEGTPIPHVLSLLVSQQAPVVAACSHGDVIPDVIEAVAGSGAAISGRGWAKGSVWVLDHDGQAWTRATYVDRAEVVLPELGASS